MMRTHVGSRNIVLVLVFGILSLFAAELYAAPLMYVPTGGSNEVLIIDLNTDEIVGRIDELENAHGLAGNAASEYLIAGSMKPPAIGDESALPVKPNAVSQDEHEGHHSGASKQSLKSAVSVIHPEHGHVMERIMVPGLTHHTAISVDGKIAAAVHSGEGSVSIIDVEAMRLSRTIKTGMWPNYAVFSQDGGKLFITNGGSNSISVIDTIAWKVVDEYAVGKKPEHMVLSRDEKKLFVANVADGTVMVVDTKTGEVLKILDAGEKPHGIGQSSDGRFLFVTAKAGNSLTRFDLLKKASKVIELSPAPYHLEYFDEGHKLYISSRKLPLIWVLDPDSLKIIKKIDIGKGVAHQMVLRAEK